VILATKVGHRSVGGNVVLDYSKEYIIEACEKSLRRLRRDSIDYYQLHSARLKQLEQGECIEAMETLKAQGKIRYWGVSLNTFHPMAEAEWLIMQNIADGLQLVFNLINQRAQEVIRKAAAEEYGVIARMPLQFGLLTGKFNAASKFAADDHRNFRLTPEIMKKTLSVLEEKVWPLAHTEEMSRTELAMNFILQTEGISTVIPGIRTAEHVRQNTKEFRSIDRLHYSYLQSLAAQDWLPVLELMEQQG
jgi:aryl-alcohol dehydrogenase-like predicted oxidoreductase